MIRITDTLLRLGTGPHLIAATLCFALFIGVVLPWQARRSESTRGHAPSADLSFAYSPDELHDLASAYGPEGRQAYLRARFSFDLVWPLAYTYFFAVVVGFALRRAAGRGSRWRLLLLLTLAPFAFDMIENVAVSAVMLAYPARHDAVARAASAATSLKWVTMGLVHLLAVAVVVAAIAAWARGRRGKGTS